MLSQHDTFLCFVIFDIIQYVKDNDEGENKSFSDERNSVQDDNRELQAEVESEDNEGGGELLSQHDTISFHRCLSQTIVC